MKFPRYWEAIVEGKGREVRFEPIGLISSQEMAGRAGITMRRLDLWVKAGRVTPAINPGGTGRPRRWLESQIGEVVEIREMEAEPARSAAAQARVRRMR